MQTTTKICKYQVTTTLKMSIGYFQIFRVTPNEIHRKMCYFYLQIFANN